MKNTCDREGCKEKADTNIKHGLITSRSYFCSRKCFDEYLAAQSREPKYRLGDGVRLKGHRPGSQEDDDAQHLADYYASVKI
jgi:hypothetical protein